MRKYQRRLRKEAGRIQEGWKLEFEDGQPREVSEVRHQRGKVLCVVDGIHHSFERDELVWLIPQDIK
ncbi:hypothetical protein B1H58_15280 [Pantoea alhagi]|uniref:Uncharacterized protein n=1 Tax=Pantoea alhagi TaxID=1891675 RepID=A0A1W6B844_9GAMM|nr:hypothetical protein [Pantoea alhagi]ARJ43260.1 hypothetical protein B1H58_15280 [Pantoea alhagi]